MTFTAKSLSLLLFLGLLHLIIAEETHVSTSIELLEPDKPRHLTLNCSQEYFFRLKESDFEKNSIYEVQFSFIGSDGFDIFLNWNTSDFSAASLPANPRFRLLDTAWLDTIHVDSKGHFEGVPESATERVNGETYYTFFAYPYRVSKSRSKEIAERPVEAIVVVFKSIGMKFRWSTISMFISVAIMVLFCLKFFIPYVVPKIPYFQLIAPDKVHRND